MNSENGREMKIRNLRGLVAILKKLHLGDMRYDNKLEDVSYETGHR